MGASSFNLQSSTDPMDTPMQPLGSDSSPSMARPQSPATNASMGNREITSDNGNSAFPTISESEDDDQGKDTSGARHLSTARSSLDNADRIFETIEELARKLNLSPAADSMVRHDKSKLKNMMTDLERVEKEARHVSEQGDGENRDRWAQFRGKKGVDLPPTWGRGTLHTDAGGRESTSASGSSQNIGGQDKLVSQPVHSTSRKAPIPAGRTFASPRSKSFKSCNSGFPRSPRPKRAQSCSMINSSIPEEPELEDTEIMLSSRRNPGLEESRWLLDEDSFQPSDNSSSTFSYNSSINSSDQSSESMQFSYNSSMNASDESSGSMQM